MRYRLVRFLSIPFVITVLASGTLADDAFYRLIKAENWAEAIKYADDKVPPPSRDAQLWASVGLAHEKMNSPERALACYRLGMSMDDKNHDIFLGASRVYNELKQHNDALDAAQKAMAIRMSGEASWEFARACIALNRTADAKKALEKVVETDANNVVANRELGNIYYNDKDFAKALPLMKRSLGRQSDSNLALRIAQAHRELRQRDSAIVYFNLAANDKSSPKPEVLAELARLYFDAKNYREAAANFDRARRNDLTADDLFNWGFSLEQTKAAEKAVIDAYTAAVAKFGGSTSVNAMTAREKVGRAAIARKAWRDADAALAPVLRADPNAKSVTDIYILMAQIAEGQNNNSATIGHLEKAISIDNKNVEAYARLADLYAKTGQAEKAKTTQERLVALDPNNPAIHMSLGDYHMKAGKHQDALRSYQRSFTINSTPEAAVGMMNAAWALKRLDVARDAAESALHRDPSLKDPQLMLVRIYMAEKNFTGARNILLPLMRTEANNLVLWKNLAEVSLALNDNQALADADKKIISLDSKDVPSRMRVAKAAERSGDLKTAYDLLKELAVLRPKDADIQKSMADIAIKQKNNAAAVTHLRAYLAIKPNDAAAHKDMGNLQFAAKDMNGALASYRAAVKADPKVTGLYQNYAAILMQNKAPAADLMPVLVAAVAANEANEAIFTAAGNEYQKQSAWPRAIEMYQKALALNNKNLANLSALALCQEKDGKISDAVLNYEQVTAMNPNATAEFKSLGDLYAQQKKMPQAVAAYKKYLEKTPTDVRTARIVGDHEFAQKNWAEANKYYAMVTGEEARRPEFLKNFAAASFEAKNFVRAGTLYKQFSDANPKDPEPLKKLYEIETANKNNRAAAEHLQKYVALVPNDAAMQKTLGDMHFDAKNNPGALAAYKNALRLDPSIKGIHARHVELVRTSGAPAAEQIAALNAAIAANEADAGMYARLGELHRAANNCKAAIPLLERASQMDKNNTGVLASIADCHVKSGNLAGAVLTLEQVTMMNPNATNEFKLLGDLYVRQNKTAEAVRAYEKFLEKGTDDAAARLVGEESFKAKNWAKAVRFLGMVKGDVSRSTPFMEMMAQAAFENKDNARAVEAYKRLSTANPQNATYVKQLYDLAVRMGAREDVVTHLRNYVRLRPNDAEMQKTLGDLLFDRRDRPGALAAYKAALAADPKIKGIHRRHVELVDASGTPAEKIAAMEGAITAGEADTTIVMRLGRVYREQKQPAKAVPIFEKAVNDNPRNVAMLLLLAQSQQDAGMIDAAILTYEKYVMMNNRAVNEHKILGDLYTRQKKPAEAIRAYRKYLETNRTDNAVALLVARQAYDAKQWSEAVRYFAMVSGPDASKPDILKMFGTAAYEAKDNPRALTVLQSLVKLTPRDADVLKMLEEVCRRTGANDLAVTHLKQYCELRPNDVEANRRLGDMLFDRKDEAGALAAYRAVLRADPKAKGFHRRFVSLVMKLGTDAEKLAALNAAIEAGEGDVAMYAELGKILKSRNEFARAAQMYEQASKLEPRNATYIGELADCQLRAGNRAAAAQNLQQAILLNPRDAAMQKTLGDIYMQDRKVNEAMDAYRKYLDATPDDPRIAQLVGDHAFEQKNWANAFKYLSMVKNNNAPEHLFRLGISAHELKNTKAAVENLERFRTATRVTNPKAPPNPNRTEAIRILAAAYENEKNVRKAAEMIEDLLKGPPPVKDQELAYKRALLVESESADMAIKIFEDNTRDYPRDHRNFLKAGIYHSRRQGGAAKAAQMFEKTVQLADTISRAHFELGLFYGSQNKNRDMMRSFEKFISIETRNADAIGRVGEYLLATKKMPAEAMMFLEMANALKPNDPKIMPLLATGYMQTGRTDEGVKLLEQVVRRTRGAPVDINIRITLGDAYLNMGRNMEAATEWKMVTDQNRDPNYLAKYATALIAVNNTSQATSIANEILAKQPDNLEALMISGRVKIAQRQYDDAMETFKKVGYINPNYAPALYERGRIFLLQQNFDWAKTFFERALKVDSKFALAELGLAQVARNQRNQSEYNKRLDRARSLDPNNKEIQDELRRAGR